MEQQQRSCLICAEKDIPLQTITGFSDNSVDSYRDHLQVILLLRKVLRLKRSFIESLLQSSGENPASWDLQLCHVCHKIFEEASFISGRLNKLNKEFEEISQTLRTKVATILSVTVSSEFSDTVTRAPCRPGRKRRRGRSSKALDTVKIDAAVEKEEGLETRIRKEVVRNSTSNPTLITLTSNVRDTNASGPSAKHYESNRRVKREILNLEPGPGTEVSGKEIEASDDENAQNSPGTNDSDFNPVNGEDGPDDIDNDNDPLDSDYIYENDNDNDVEISGEDNNDSDYEPQKSSKRLKITKVHSSTASSDSKQLPDRSLILRAVKMENNGSYQCPKCQQVYATSALCNEHIFQTHYGGNWPLDFTCHLCSKKFYGEFRLRHHMMMRHPGEKLPTDEVLERSIEEGTAPELTYSVIPLGQKGKGLGGNGSDNSTGRVNRIRSVSTWEEPSPDTFYVPVLQVQGKIRYLVLPDEFLQMPEEFLKTIRRGPEDKVCPNCPKTFPTELQMQGHILYAHQGESNCYPCSLCPKKFERIGKLLNHMLSIHVSERRYFCNRCGQTFQENILLQAHIQKKHFGIVCPFKCIVCGTRHAGRNHLNKHLKRRHRLQIEDLAPGNKKKRAPIKLPKTERPTPKLKPKSKSGFRRKKWSLKKSQNIPCQICSEEKSVVSLFPNQEELEVHVKRVHHGIPRPYACSICGKKYSHPVNLDHHMTSHEVRSDLDISEDPPPPEPPKFECLICQRSFKTKALLNSHISKIHEDNPPTFVCELCSKAFREVNTLKGHQFLMHWKELNLTPYKCEYCERILSSKRRLNDHIKIIHTKTAKFNCPHCDFVFQYQSEMNNHINNRHLKKNILLCPHCPKTFTMNAYLKSHLRVHTGEKPYKCQTCGKDFSDKPTYNRHVEAHSNVIHSCTVCGRSGFKTRHALRVHMKNSHPESLESEKKKNELIIPPSSSPSSVPLGSSSLSQCQSQIDTKDEALSDSQDLFQNF